MIKVANLESNTATFTVAFFFSLKSAQKEEIRAVTRSMMLLFNHSCGPRDCRSLILTARAPIFAVVLNDGWRLEKLVDLL
jgi:hypothetical protein